MNVVKNEQNRQFYLQERLHYYLQQGEYLNYLQVLYRELEILYQDLQRSYDDYRQDKALSGKDATSDRILILKEQLSDIRREISKTLKALEVLEKRGSK